MKLSTFANPLPQPQDPIIDLKSGAYSLVTGRQFFQALWNRTGGGSGIIPSVKTGLIAQGNSQLTALVLQDDWNEIDTVAAATGVQIPTLQPGQAIAIFNAGANALSIYPPGGGAIDALAVNVAYSLGHPQLQIFWVWAANPVQLRSFGRLQIP